MKKIISIIVLALFLFSCKNQENKAIDYVILSGKITNTKGGKLKISSLNGFSKTINVKDTGTFIDTLFIEEDGLYNLQFKQIRFTPYLSQGGNIQLKVDAKQALKSLKLSGYYANLNNYYAYKASKEFDFMMNREAIYNVDENTFKAKIKTFQNDLEQKLNNLEGIPENIKLKEKRSLNYSRLSKKSNYENLYKYLSKNPEFKASDNFKKELLDMSFNNADDYLYSIDYQQIIENHIRQKAIAYYQNDSLAYPKAEAKAISEIENEVIRNAELYKNIPMTLTRSNKKQEDLQNYLKASTNEKQKKNIKELYETLKVLDSGQPSPKFVNYENYNGDHTSLDDLKGKYIYIDVWATWCGPCKYEIPFLKKVEKKYHNKNIYFVSISTDKQKDKAKWKNMVADKKLGGIQLITDNDFNTPFISSYKIMGIPKFILLDPKGHIIQANAPRPSEEKLIELLDKLKI